MVDDDSHTDAARPASGDVATHFHAEGSDQSEDDRVAPEEGHDSNGTRLSIPAARQSVAAKPPAAAKSHGSATSRAPNAAANGSVSTVDDVSLSAAVSKSRTGGSTVTEITVSTTTNRPVERGCEKQPCRNDADCSTDPIGPRGFSCRCRPGFYGTLCEYGMLKLCWTTKGLSSVRIKAKREEKNKVMNVDKW
jgi:hypothetical protein